MIKEFKTVDGYELAHTYSISEESVIYRETQDRLLLSISNSRKGYRVVSLVLANRKKRQFFVHRILVSVFKQAIPIGMTVDHINRDKSDNRLENLRVASRAQQTWNCKSHPKNRFKGVTWHKNDNKWCARGFKNGIRIHLGCFDSEISAAVAYDLWVLKNRDAHAHTNLIHIADTLSTGVSE